MDNLADDSISNKGVGLLPVIKDVLLQLLFALMPFVAYNIYYRKLTVNYSRNFILLICSLCMLLSMTFASSVQSGLIFDVRYVIMFFGILFGGFMTGAILLIEFLIYRLHIGGSGMIDAIIILIITFPLSVLLATLYHKSKHKFWIVFIAGISFSLIPLLVLYITKPDYILSHFIFNVLVMPVHNSLGIWLLVTLFNKSVSDKELYLQYIQNEKAEAVNHVAASLAHEVRNPLTTVLGFLQLIKSGTFPQEKTDRFLEISMEEIRRTEQILSEYLSISKPLVPFQQKLELTAQIRSVVELMTSYANMSNITLSADYPELPVYISGSPAELKQLLVNFIKNAIEASRDVDKGCVNIRIYEEAEQVAIEIQDNGIGMNPEQLSRLGSIYYSTKMSGTGLGLTFSYQAIRAMDGSVSVRSSPRSGTVFLINLPLAATDP
ncbi:GHKL domain-containing protein [Paenibacillus glucanolyticus]|uniref:ATP-binding protein n=1 Tax=Paenibacillus TaxID=44249 RepID=UPI0003E1DEEB|nr:MULTISPECIES: sensor histidine kinase [Paenibacillus]ANA83437.1 two-component sensor histidine kinase [Paenibacillus glucanolyticus]AVV60355.1 GHKL domain-containing protein [Paenibacillus glucanolyticus]ETT35863.1 integral membrane sensor signal transduction histidine kinase [Paenibacillus sp. FSL R5-808]MPY19956.1 GHKL domain-containing protein [Paenibacillus glucanolyticus]